jgi:hypothetical protein
VLELFEQDSREIIDRDLVGVEHRNIALAAAEARVDVVAAPLSTSLSIEHRPHQAHPYA